MRPITVAGVLALFCECVTQPLAAQADVSVQIVGSVFDSVSMTALPHAQVRLVRAGDPSIGRSVATDSLGAFRFDSVPGGAWLATFSHAVLDSLLLEPAIVRIDLRESGSLVLSLTTPAPRSLVTSACGTATPADDGVLVGTVRRASDERSVPGVTVQAIWPEWVVRRKSMQTELQAVSAQTDTLGRYVLCGLPNNSVVRSRAYIGADSTGDIEVALHADGYSRAHFLLPEYATVTAPGHATGQAAPYRVGRASIHGNVRNTDGLPLADAIVRVLGSGSPVRSASDGGFTIQDLVSGTRTIEARKLGFTPHRVAIDLRESTLAEVTLILPAQRVQLDTVRVATGRDVPYQVRAIERRARSGTGTMLSGELIRERSTLWVTDALRGMNGLLVRQGAQGNAVQMRDLQGTPCAPFVYIDGVLTKVGGLETASVTIDDFVSRGDVAAVEVYPRANLVPVEFNGGITGCGAIAVWSRYGTGGVPVLPQKSGRARQP